LRRNTLVLAAVLLILATFAWAGWANWEYRRQAAEKMAASSSQGTLVAVPAGNAPTFVSPLNGKDAPAFALDDLSGKKVSLANYHGKAVLVNFWATWCGPCKIETPWLVELRNKYAAQGFEILGVDAEADDLKPGDTAGWAKTKAAVSKFIAEEKVDYPMLLNGDSIADKYGDPDALPASFFVDRNGKVVIATLGLSSESDIEDNIKKVLNQ